MSTMLSSATSDWYTSCDGAITGPFSFEEIEGQIRSGRVTRLDLVYNEGYGRWVLFNEIAEFQNAFSAAFSSAFQTANREQPSRKGDWIVLKKDESASHVLGPFERDQIFSMLSSGELKYTDSVWRPGEDKWLKISECGEFDRRAMSPHLGEVAASPSVNFEADPTQINRIPIHDLLGNIARVDRSSKPMGESNRPAGAAGEDLAQNVDLAKLMKRHSAVVIFCLSILAQGAFAAAGVSVKTTATALQRERLSLFYAAKRMAELIRRLPQVHAAGTRTADEKVAAETWMEDFEEARTWVREARPKVPSAQAESFRTLANGALVEFEDRSKNKRGPASDDSQISALTKAAESLRDDIRTGFKSGDAPEEPTSDHAD